VRSVSRGRNHLSLSAYPIDELLRPSRTNFARNSVANKQVTTVEEGLGRSGPPHGPVDGPLLGSKRYLHPAARSSANAAFTRAATLRIIASSKGLAMKSTTSPLGIGYSVASPTSILALTTGYQRLRMRCVPWKRKGRESVVRSCDRAPALNLRPLGEDLPCLCLGKSALEPKVGKATALVSLAVSVGDRKRRVVTVRGKTTESKKIRL
jgi:hypothetical protein